MQTLIRKGTNVSLYLWDDTTVIVVGTTNTIVGDPPEYIIGDCTVYNSTLYEGVTAPEDWVGGKYLYTPDGGWVPNPNWNPITMRAE